MPFATNPTDGVRTYFEDTGGGGWPVLFYPGFTDPLEYAKETPLARALPAESRLIFADHRGQGRSDKPREAESYALTTRVDDVVAVLDELGIGRAHFIGFSWGARLGFALGEQRPERVLSLVLCGNQPYEWDLSSPMALAVSRAAETLEEEGMAGFVERWEASIGARFPEPSRSWILENDPAAIHAAWRSVDVEGAISEDLTRWRVPCLIYAGELDEMHDNARRAASEIPGAVFLSLPGHTHFSAEGEIDQLLPHVRELFLSATPEE